MDLSIKDLDWRSLLIKNYRSYGINENDLAVLLCINDALKEFHILVTADDLVSYMTLEKKDIDESLVKLVDKKLIEYVKEDKKIITSLTPLFNRIISDLKKDIILDSKDTSKARIKESVDSLYSYFENVTGKPLSGRDVDRVASWIKSGADERMVHEAVEKLKAQRKVVSIAAVDKIILALQKSKDINSEGFSPRKGEWREGSEETLKILSQSWVPHE